MANITIVTVGSLKEGYLRDAVAEYKKRLSQYARVERVNIKEERIADEDDLYSIGFDDYLARRGILFVEWSELVPNAIPKDALHLSLSRTDGETGRRIVLKKGAVS